MNKREYKTISACATAEFEEKKSRFIATTKPVVDEHEAVEFINKLKSKYWDATHNVYAYSIGGENIIQRFSDDGEPSGTAGFPVLEVIKRMELRDIVIVVTRYFGGVQLGAGGLVRAYTKSASIAIDASGVAIRKLSREICLVLEYPVFEKVRSRVLSYGYIIKNIEYTQEVRMFIMVPVNEINKFRENINEITNGEALIELGEKEYI